MLKEYSIIMLELFLGFAALFLYTKALGKSYFAQLTPFDFISALVLGDLLGNAIYDPETHIGKVLFATLFWGLLVWLLATLTQKFSKLRKPLEGQPNMLIRRGRLQYQALKKNRLDLNQVQTMLREKGYFSLGSIEYAILEPNGAISVLPRSEHETIARKDVGLSPPPAEMPISLILDGDLVQDNMRLAGVDQEWIYRELRKRNIRDISDVFFAEWSGEDNLYIATYK